MLDIGAGAGAITRRSPRPARVCSRSRLIRVARAISAFAFSGQNVKVVRADAADLRLPRRPFVVVANPPFAITTALLKRLLGSGQPPRSGRADRAPSRRGALDIAGAPGAHRWMRTFDLRSRCVSPAIGLSTRRPAPTPPCSRLHGVMAPMTRSGAFRFPTERHAASVQLVGQREEACVERLEVRPRGEQSSRRCRRPTPDSLSAARLLPPPLTVFFVFDRRMNAPARRFLCQPFPRWTPRVSRTSECPTPCRAPLLAVHHHPHADPSGNHSRRPRRSRRLRQSADRLGQDHRLRRAPRAPRRRGPSPAGRVVSSSLPLASSRRRSAKSCSSSPSPRAPGSRRSTAASASTGSSKRWPAASTSRWPAPAAWPISIQQKAVDLRDVDLVVIDEADRMADMGFLPEVKRILDACATDRQTLLFSATLDGDVDVLIRRYQRDPARHETELDEVGRTTSPTCSGPSSAPPHRHHRQAHQSTTDRPSSSAAPSAALIEWRASSVKRA